MPILTFTGSQHRLKLPEAIKNRAAPWIQTQSGSAYRNADQAPFRRMIDFWFMSIAWAVYRDQAPVETVTGQTFVNLGPNDNDIKNFEEWRANLITILAVRDFGIESADISDTRKVIDLANRYAEAGAPLLLEDLMQNIDLALPRLYHVTETLSDVVTETAKQHNGRTY